MSKKDKIFITIISILGAVIIALSIFLSLVVVELKNKDKISYYDSKCKSYAVQNTNLSNGQIVFIGDSITDLYPLDSHYSELTIATYNRGIGGDTTVGVLARLDVSLFDLEPSKIVLMIGINDLNAGRSNDDIITNYQQILNKIKERLPETKVYCMSVLPMAEALLQYFSDLNERIERIIQLNVRISEIAEEKGYKFVDLFSHVEDGSHYLRAELTDDSLHLNANGFAIWASVLKPYLV